MRLHRISLKNFRGVESHEVALAPSGITVIEGDNGVGKTSLIDAVWLMFDNFDTSTSYNVRRNRPEGRDADPEVEVDVSLGNCRMTYRKRFNSSQRRASTRLEIHEPTRQTLTGRDAHNEANRILGDNVDIALLRALWLNQGVSLDQADLSTQTSLGAALDRAAGRSADGDSEEPLFQRCQTEYERYFTSRGYRQPVQQVIDRHKAAVAEVEILTKSIAELDDKNDECERLDKDIERLKSRLSERFETLENLESRHAEVTRVSQEVDGLKTELALAQERLERAESDRERRMEDVKAIAKSQHELDGFNLAAQSLDSQVKDAEQALEIAQDEVETARDALNASRRLLDLRRADHAHLLESAGVDGMAARLETAKQSSENARAAQSFLNDCRITDSLLARIEDAERKILINRARLDSEGASVEIVSHAAQQIVLDGEPTDVADGQRIQKTGLHNYAFSVPGVVDVTVSAGQGSQQLATDLAALESDLAGLLQSASVADVNAARQLNQQRIRTQDDLERERGAIRQALGDSSIPDLENQIAQTRERADRYLADRDSDIPMPADANAAGEDARQAERLVSDKQAAFNAAESRGASAREAYDAIRSKQVELNANIKIASDRLESDKQSLESARETETDEAIEERVKSLSKAAADADALLSKAKSQLAGMDPVGLKARLETAGNIVKSLETQIRERGEELRDARAFLNARGEDGLHDELDRAKSELERAEREKIGVESRAAAAKLLYETISRRRDETRARYQAPFREKIESLGKVVFGDGFSVELDDDLRVKNATLRDAPLEFIRHSTGEREQIGLLSRLACAAIVSEDGGVPLVLDDALGWSDPTRLADIGAALNMGARDCQVIALTCMPDRYSQVGAEKTIRLTR